MFKIIDYKINVYNCKNINYLTFLLNTLSDINLSKKILIKYIKTDELIYNYKPHDKKNNYPIFNSITNNTIVNIYNTIRSITKLICKDILSDLSEKQIKSIKIYSDIYKELTKTFKTNIKSLLVICIKIKANFNLFSQTSSNDSILEWEKDIEIANKIINCNKEVVIVLNKILNNIKKIKNLTK